MTTEEAIIELEERIEMLKHFKENIKHKEYKSNVLSDEIEIYEIALRAMKG